MELEPGSWSVSVTDEQHARHLIQVWGADAWIDVDDGSSPYTWYDCAVDGDLRRTTSHRSLDGAIEAGMARLRRAAVIGKQHPAGGRWE